MKKKLDNFSKKSVICLVYLINGIFVYIPFSTNVMHMYVFMGWNQRSKAIR